MCDWSLEAVKSREANVGDKLAVTRFTGACSKGLADVSDIKDNVATTAVCLMPGTEVAFDNDVEINDIYGQTTTIPNSRVAKFIEVDPDKPHTYHDTFEFLDGTQVKVHTLTLGQTVSVLQLPAQPLVSHMDLPATTEETTTIADAQPEAIGRRLLNALEGLLS